MRLDELIVALAALEEAHGSDIEVLINHTPIEIAQFIPAGNGSPDYISIESE